MESDTLECNERRRYRSRKLSGGINPVESGSPARFNSEQPN
ncbi:putative outer membrane domain protein [Escherichia coli 2-052-05_S4_C3]|nr:putative outer membrane domain protein [Escherichia coli 2-052-05_S4_C3]